MTDKVQLNPTFIFFWLSIRRDGRSPISEQYWLLDEEAGRQTSRLFYLF